MYGFIKFINLILRLAPATCWVAIIPVNVRVTLLPFKTILGDTIVYAALFKDDENEGDAVIVN